MSGRALAVVKPNDAVPGVPYEMTKMVGEQVLPDLLERAGQRAVIVLHDVEGFKHSEIGEMLGIPEGTARSDLHYARSQLRGILGSVRRAL